MAYPPSAPPPPTGISQDPHLYFAHGGKADFRGRNGQMYNFFSAPDVSVNLKTEEAEFTLNRGRLTVNGSFITEAHLVARGGQSRQIWANLSYWASELGDLVASGTERHLRRTAAPGWGAGNSVV